MKSKLAVLLRMQFLGSFGINKMLHSKKKGALAGLGFSAAGIVLLFALVEALICLYAWMAAQLAAGAMMQGAYFPVVFLLVAIVTFALTVANVNGKVFGFRDYEMTVSLPVSTAQLASAKILFVYLENLAASACILLPFWIFGGAMMPFSVETHLCVLLVLFFVPLVPSALAVFVGALLAVVTARMKRKELVQTIFFILVIVAACLLPVLTSGTGDGTAIESPLELPAWLRAPFEKFWAACVFAAASAAVFSLPCVFIGKNFARLNTMILSRKSSSAYKKKELKTSGKVRALFRKEIKALFSCPEYSINALTGTIIAVLVPVILIVTVRGEFSDLRAAVFANSALIAPYFTAFMLFSSLTPTTYCSISLEGKSLWILRSAPLDGGQVLLSKMLVHLAAETLPGVLVAAVFGGVLGFGFFYVLSSVLCVAAMSAALGGFALLLNLRFPVLEWEKISVPVKQSRSCLFSMLVSFAGLGLVLLIGALCASVNAWLGAVMMPIFCFACLFLSLGLLSACGRKLYDRLLR